MHVNKHYVPGEDGINWQQYFTRTGLLENLNETLGGVADTIDNQINILTLDGTT